MYTEKVKKEMKEMKELLERADRLNAEAKVYDGEAEPILYNIEKIKDQYNEKKKDMLARYEVTKKQFDEGFKKRVDLLKENFEKEKKLLEEPFNKKIEDLNKRIERLQSEKAIYEKDGDSNDAIQNNIDRLEEEIRVLNETEGKQIAKVLEEKENSINARIEETKQKVNAKMAIVRKDLAEMGIDVEEYKLGEEEKQEEQVAEEKEEIQETEIEQNEQEEVEETQEIEPEEIQEPEQNEQEEIEEEVEEPQYREETIPDVTIRYLAQTDEYELIDKDRNERYVYARTELEPIDKEMISERLGIPMENLANMNSDVVRILRDFDRMNGTHKLAQYRRAIIQTELSKKEMKEEMYFAGIKIDYDLRGLYKGQYTPEEIQEILQNANNAKEVGSGTVKKGIITTIREKIGNFVNKIKNTKLLSGNKTQTLPEPEEMDEYIAEKINKEYWNSINEKDFKKSLRQAQDRKDLREKLETLKAEKNYYEMMNQKEELVNAEYLDSIDGDYKKAVKEEHDKKVLEEKLEMLKAEKYYDELMHPAKYAIEKADAAAKEKLGRKDEDMEEER